MASVEVKTNVKQSINQTKGLAMVEESYSSIDFHRLVAFDFDKMLSLLNMKNYNLVL